MPFRGHVRVEITNGSPRALDLYFQLDATLGPVPDDAGLLHVSFRRENPTTMGRDFVIADGFRGPGRFVGCAVGLRVLDDGFWYGEGEVKVYRDGDRELPTICGTGLEDYVGTAWGMGPHHAPLRGCTARGDAVAPRRRSPTSSASTAGTSSTRSCSTTSCGSRSSRSAWRCS